MQKFFTRGAWVFFFALFAQSAVASLPESVTNVLTQKGLDASRLAVLVKDGDRVVFASNETRPMRIASTAKIVTTLAALDILSPAYTWKTAFYTASGTQTRSSTLTNLYIKGGLDPHYVYEDLVKDVLRLKSMGVTKISGQIVIDRAKHAKESAPSNSTRSYNLTADAALFNFNSVVLRISPRPDKSSALIAPEIALEGFSAPKSVPMRQGFCPAWRQTLKSDFSNPLRPIFRGFFPSSCSERVLTYAVTQENALWSAGIRAVLKDFGIRFSGKVVSGTVPKNARFLFTHEGFDVAHMVRLTNKFSNNMLARHLFLTIGAPEENVPATYAKSRAKLQAWLTQKGIREPIVIENGSGLSDKTRATPEAMSRVLELGLNSPFSYEWISSFPIAGVDGTMKSRPVAGGTAHIKTGQLDDVRSIAGVVQTQSGKTLTVFAAYNGPKAAEAVAALDALLAACARY